MAVKKYILEFFIDFNRDKCLFIFSFRIYSKEIPMTRKPRGVDWSAIWSNKNKCGHHAKGWCVKHKQCCKKYIKVTNGDCWTPAESLPPENLITVEQLRKLQPSRVKDILSAGSF